MNVQDCVRGPNYAHADDPYDGQTDRPMTWHDNFITICRVIQYDYNLSFTYDNSVFWLIRRGYSIYNTTMMQMNHDFHIVFEYKSVLFISDDA